MVYICINEFNLMKTTVTPEQALAFFTAKRIQSHLRSGADQDEVQKLIVDCVEQADGNVDTILTEKVKGIEDVNVRYALYRMFVAYKYEVSAHADSTGTPYVEFSSKRSFVIHYPESSAMVAVTGEMLVPRGKYIFYVPGGWVLAAKDINTGKYGMIDYAGRLVCPCVCQGIYTSEYAREVGTVTYKGLKVYLNLKPVREQKYDDGVKSYMAHFKSETYDCAIEFSHSVYDSLDMDDDMIEIEPGVVVSRNWAEQRGYDVDKILKIDKDALFKELIELVSCCCERL